MARRGRRPSGGGDGDDLMRWYAKDRMRPDPRVDADVERSCTSKRQYSDELNARAQAAMQGMSDVLFQYECRYCGFWHLTRRQTLG